MKKLFVLFLVFGMALGLSISSVSTDKTSYAPGDTGYISIVLTNADTASVDDITLQASAGGNIALGTTVLTIGDLGPASSTTINIPIAVSKTATSGMYFVRVEATGSITSVTPIELKRTESVAAVKVVKSPVLSISMDETELEKETAVVLTLCNEGGNARDVIVTLDGNIGFAGADSIFIGDVGQECKKINANLDAKRAEDGSNTLQLNLRYKNELGEDKSEEKEIGVVVNKREGDFSIEQTNIMQTKTETVLGLVITNAGNDARNVKISFADDSIRLVGKNKIYAGNIAKGEQKEIETDVYVNAEPGITSVNVSIEWEENGEKKEDVITVPIKVKSDADVGIYIEAKPAPLRANGEHTLSITVANLGSYAISSVSITLQSDVFELQEAQAEKYIGGLGYDDFSSEQFKVKVNNVKPGSYPLNITVVYRDYSGEWVTKSVETSVLIEGAIQEGGNNTALLVVIGLVVIVAAYYFLKMRKKSKGLA
ncbi:MAG: COG1361 S-layer family protein [Candidatus Anstonellales archaeon]